MNKLDNGLRSHLIKKILIINKVYFLIISYEMKIALI